MEVLVPRESRGSVPRCPVPLFFTHAQASNAAGPSQANGTTVLVSLAKRGASHVLVASAKTANGQAVRLTWAGRRVLKGSTSVKFLSPLRLAIAAPRLKVAVSQGLWQKKTAGKGRRRCCAALCCAGDGARAACTCTSAHVPGSACLNATWHACALARLLWPCLFLCLCLTAPH